jgi:hypothetical protein
VFLVRHGMLRLMRLKPSVGGGDITFDPLYNSVQIV